MKNILTKSRFKMGFECSNKLFFSIQSDYPNSKIDDPFLEALAQGGFQVEELARAYYPQGKYYKDNSFEDLLNRDHSVLFETPFTFENLYVRTDIVEKKNGVVRLIEVKAKSFDPSKENEFVAKRGGLVNKWKSYLYDLAFQKYVAQLQYPQLTFKSYFLLPNINKKASVDGLNQLFGLSNKGNRYIRQTSNELNFQEIGDSILELVDVDYMIDDILNDKFPLKSTPQFKDLVKKLNEVLIYKQYPGEKIRATICKKCEFKATTEQLQNGFKSGFNYCFSKQFGWSEKDFDKPNILDIWNFKAADKLFENQKYFLSDLEKDDLKIEISATRFSYSERQWIQIEKSQNQDQTYLALKEDLKAEMDQWVYPLHFIDFETHTSALPFNKGLKPYEQVAFQFSHHLVYEDGRIEHHSEWINAEPGHFPNFDFARALKKSLEKDSGSIFRYASHENTVLNKIIDQLNESEETDKMELIEFLNSITCEKSLRVGERNMIDLQQMVKDYYYNPLTGGSNSLKFVLPAILASSPYLQNKYSQPIGKIGLNSKNFPSEHVWLAFEDEITTTTENPKVVNPYNRLPQLFENWTDEELEEVYFEGEKLENGGAAMMAYAKLQYVDMSPAEREVLKQGLLKYCELDTLAMVMLYEHFRYEVVL